MLTRDEFWCPNVVAVVRLLLLTGCRMGEILSLEWSWIKGKRIFLPDAKCGSRTVWLSSAARAVIDAIPRYSDDCPYLFPGRPPTRPIDNIGFQWTRIRDEAGLPGLRLHDLRHTWASVAAMNGVDMVTIAKLLGHALIETTERYVHLSDQSVTEAADRVSARLSAGPRRQVPQPHTEDPPCPALDSLRGWRATASPATKTPSCSTRACRGSGCESTPPAARSGSCRPGSRAGAAGCSSPATGR